MQMITCPRRNSKTSKNAREDFRSPSWFSVTLLGLLVLIFLSPPLYSWAFDGKYHNGEIQDALPFLRTDILETIIPGDLNQDDCWLFDCPSAHSANHYDACDFEDSVANINSKYGKLYFDSNPVTSQYFSGEFSRAYTFGQLLHPVQDFYSHTNWVELLDYISFSPPLLSDSLGLQILDPWDSPPGHPELKVMQFTTPPQWSFAKQLTPVIRDVNTHAVIGHGLFSHGRSGVAGGDDCPDELIGYYHRHLNKDGPENDQYVGDPSLYYGFFGLAKTLATYQTNHEFCRLLNLMAENGNYEKASVLMGLWVEGKVLFSAYSPCGLSEVGGDRTITVTPEIINIMNDTDPGNDPGDLNLAFTVYTGDFKKSVRTQVGMEHVSEGLWPSAKLPSPLSICVNHQDRIVATIQGWDDEDDKNPIHPEYDGYFNGYHFIAPGVSPATANEVLADTPLKGVTTVVNLATQQLPLGTGAISDDIEVRFHITGSQGCEPGVTGAAGNSSGKNLKSADSDFDGTPDSKDNCSPFPNPAQNDSNGDGIGDACDGDIPGKQGGPLKNDVIDFNTDGVIDSKDICPYSVGTNKTNDIHHIANICYPYGIAVPVSNNTNSTINATVTN